MRRRVIVVAGWLSVVLAMLALPAVVLGQDAESTPVPRQAPRHSATEVWRLSPPAASVPSAPPARETKPFLTRDPQALKRWKDLIEQSPEAVPPGPGTVVDPEQ